MRLSHFGVLGLVLVGCDGSDKPDANNNGGNVAPTFTGVELTPEPAYEATVLNCTPLGATDGDGDTVTFSYTWTVSGADIAETTQTLNGQFFSKGDIVSCTATPNDGTQDGSPATSNQVEILNTPPRANSVTIDPDPADVLATLTASPLGFTDDDGDPESWEYEWFVNGTAAGTNDNLQGAFVKGDEVYVVATPDDGTDLGDPVQSPSLTIANSPPVFTGATITPASPSVVDILQCQPTGGYDADGDTVVPDFAWFVNGQPAGSNTELLAAPNFARGDSVYCEITPNDGEDTGPVVTSPSVTVINSEPTVSGVTLGPDPATENDTLTCSASSVDDPDGDNVNLQFSWTVGGVAIGATSSTLNGTSFNKGQAVVCTITPNDGIVNGQPGVSNAVIIANSPPTATTADITPTNPDTNTDVTAVASGWVDADGDPAQWQWQWYVNGSPLPGATTSNLSSANYVKNDVLSCEVIPFDGQDTGPSVFSGNVPVINSPPSAPIVQITPPIPDSADNLVCSITLGSSDADGDTVMYTYNWKKNGTDAGITNNTVPSASTAYGDVWLCEVTPDDGEDIGPIGSASVPVTDTSPPGAPSLDQLTTPRNETTTDVTGTAEPNSTVDVYVSCDLGSSGTAQTAAAPDGSFTIVWNMLPGETCDFYATSTDAQGNVSASSNTVFTEVCGTLDIWEDGTYGNSGFQSIDEWNVLPDDGNGLISITGTILPGDPGDWYVVHTTDDVSNDAFVGYDNYNLHAMLTDGVGTYTFIVYKGDVGIGNVECSGQNDGYEEYNDANYSSLWSSQTCKGSNTDYYDTCTDYTNSYYIEVIRNPAVAASCQPYTIEFTNGLPYTP